MYKIMFNGNFSILHLFDIEINRISLFIYIQIFTCKNTPTHKRTENHAHTHIPVQTIIQPLLHIHAQKNKQRQMHISTYPHTKTPKHTCMHAYMPPPKKNTNIPPTYLYTHTHIPYIYTHIYMSPYRPL